MKRPWTAEDVAQLRALYGTAPADTVAAQLQRSYLAVVSKASALGLGTKATWTAADDELLRSLYPETDMAAIETAMGRSTFALRVRAAVLGIKRVSSPNIAERGRQHSRFMRQRRASGYRNPTTLPLWAIREHGGKCVIKVAETGDARQDWELAHRFIWAFLHGPIPADHVVMFRDGDTSNYDPANLELVSSGEKMQRYSIARYPREYHRTAVVLGRFKAKLKRLEEAQ